MTKTVSIVYSTVEVPADLQLGDPMIQLVDAGINNPVSSVTVPAGTPTVAIEVPAGTWALRVTNMLSNGQPYGASVDTPVFTVLPPTKTVTVAVGLSVI